MAHQPAISFPIQVFLFSNAPVGAHQTLGEKIPSACLESLQFAARRTRILKCLWTARIETPSRVRPPMSSAASANDVSEANSECQNPKPVPSNPLLGWMSAMSSGNFTATQAPISRSDIGIEKVLPNYLESLVHARASLIFQRLSQEDSDHQDSGGISTSSGEVAKSEGATTFSSNDIFSMLP